jgi:hypothetical protein
MKKLFTFLCFAFLVGWSANVFAQDSGINPEVGSQHTYSVTAVTGTTVTYSWKVTTSEDFVGGTDLLSAAEIVSGTSATNSITLTWAAPDVETIYYLHLEVIADGCKNNKVIAIEPKNNFTMQIANVNSEGTEISDTYSECPADVISSDWNGTDEVTALNATDFTYDYGVNTFYFTITADGINTSNTEWNPKFDITSTSTGTVTAFGGNTIAGATNAITVGSNTINVSGSSEYFIKVVVTNGIDEGTTARTVTVDLDPTTFDENNNTVTNTGKDNLTQTITSRPNPGDIVPD